MGPQEFVKKWANSDLGEKQIAQAHFLDLCKLVGAQMPGGDGKTAAGKSFVFEQALKKTSGHGFADVYYEGHFAIEYKAPQKYKDLNAAYDQLLQYRENLQNPPLLAVTDINRWEIHSNFPNTQKRVYAFAHEEIASNPEVLGWLHDMFHAPERLHPRRNTEHVTKEAARVFQLIADNMRGWQAEPERIAYFLTKLVFCLFAEDIGLLPTAANSPDGIFTHIIKEARRAPSVFRKYVQNLFVAMNDGSEVLMREIPYFNGTLFNVVTVEELSAEALDALADAAKLNWESIEPSIFGTLFERSLDPSKRSQLGAHYTSRADMLLIVEPVLMQPLRYEWDTVQLEAAPIRGRYDKARTGKAKANASRQLLDLRERILERLRATTVLDPACGSGNFLYLSLQLLMDLEKEIIQHPLWAGLQMPAPEVHPRQMYGIEINPIAHALASIVVWIGYIQWRKNNGYGRAFSEPILEELEGNIVCRDAILPPAHGPHPPTPSPKMREGELGFAEHDMENQSSNASEARTSLQEFEKSDNKPLPLDGGGVWGGGVNWPRVDVIVGNPPFLGNKKMQHELGEDYYWRLIEHYDGRIPGGVDLVCYWFEVARQQIEDGKAKRAGLLATNSIRGGSNREVLKRIKLTGDIFMAWSDRPWILDGAAVRVSIICFEDGSQESSMLDGIHVISVYSDLTADVDITGAKNLYENERLSFQAIIKRGPFDMDASLAQTMISTDPFNKNVLKPIINGIDITRRPRNKWIVDFGVNTPIESAQRFLLPFAYVEKHVKPVRAKTKQPNSRAKWWLHTRPRPEMRNAIKNLPRYIATPAVAKHRLFVWLEKFIHPDHALIVFARDDDYFFGVLHSKLHEVWSLRMGTSLEDRPRYTPTTTFETFPFPWSPSREDRSHPAYATISAAAKQLHEERHAWLNPAGKSEKQLKDRTLTNLYNALLVYRGRDSIKVKPAAGDFAPRLDELHRALDEAVCAAYGWDVAILADEEEILRRLLALNLARLP